MMKSKYKLGRLIFSIEGNGPLKTEVEEEMSPLRQDLPEPETLQFNFTDRPTPNAHQFVCAKPTKSWADGFLVEDSGMCYTTQRHDGRIAIEVALLAQQEGIRRRLMPAWWKRFKDWNYLSALETVAKNFMYNVFDYISQIQNLSTGQSYIHASAFEKDGRGVAILAWGGIGKTTSMLKMVLERNWCFLSDDLAVVDDSGTVYRSPKRMQIYAYNLKGEPDLAKGLFKGRSFLDRVSWSWRLFRFGDNRVRRRVSAEELFGEERVHTNAALRDAIFAERHSGDYFDFYPATAEEIARRAAPIVMKELDPYSTIYAAIHGSGNIGALPAYEDVKCRTERILCSALKNSKTVIWKIPLQATPAEIFESLDRYLNVESQFSHPTEAPPRGNLAGSQAGESI